MAVELKQHIELRGDNPLSAVIVGTNYKAYLVANLAFNDGISASSEHYGIESAQVHAAITFYLDNQESIEANIQKMQELGRQLGEKTSDEFREEIKRRQQET